MHAGPALTLTALMLGAGTKEAAAYEPAVNYQLHCMGCHLADGSGQAGRVPSVRRTLPIFSRSARGRDFVIRVPGVAQSPLSDEDTAALLNWMTLRLSDARAADSPQPYTATEVHALRAHPLSEVDATRRRLLSRTAAAAATSAR